MSDSPSRTAAGAGMIAEPLFEQATVPDSHSDLRYAEAGRGPETIVVLAVSGSLPVPRTWELMAEAGHRVVVLEVPEGDDAEGDEVRQVRSGVEALVQGDFHIIGLSSSSRTAVRLCVEMAGRVKSLTLISPTLIQTEATEVKPLAEYEPSMHILVVVGTRDPLVPAHLLRHYRTMMPGAELSLVYDAGHAIDSDRPEVLANLLDRFVSDGADYKVTTTTGVLFP